METPVCPAWGLLCCVVDVAGMSRPRVVSGDTVGYRSRTGRLFSLRFSAELGCSCHMENC